jgi:hypothetical protein
MPMHSTSSNLWPVDDAEHPAEALEYICIATNLLQQMFSALQSLAKNHPDLACEMTSRESTMRHRLWTLHGTVDLLVSVKDQAELMRLMRRATALISWLSSETDALALYATGQEDPFHACRSVVH